MSRLARISPSACLLLAACVGSPAVTAVSSAPEGCAPLGEVDTGGVVYERGATAEAVRRLKKKTQDLGGDTLVCCSLSDRVVLYRYEGEQYSGRAYRCGRPDEA